MNCMVSGSQAKSGIAVKTVYVWYLLFIAMSSGWNPNVNVYASSFLHIHCSKLGFPRHNVKNTVISFQKYFEFGTMPFLMGKTIN